MPFRAPAAEGLPFDRGRSVSERQEDRYDRPQVKDVGYQRDKRIKMPSVKHGCLQVALHVCYERVRKKSTEASASARKRRLARIMQRLFTFSFPPFSARFFIIFLIIYYKNR